MTLPDISWRLIPSAALLAFASLLPSYSRAENAPSETAGFQDVLTLGDASSEKSHAFEAAQSEVIKGLLDQPARRLLPLNPAAWNGSTAKFRMKVDPEKENYFTAKFSGSEVNANRLVLYVEGKQIGWRHLGEVDQLDFGTWEPAYSGRYYYNTSPLPLSLTKGHTELEFEIRSSGPIWGYGQDFEHYQKPMTEPSRGIYRAYTHIDGCFTPPADEKQGPKPVNIPTCQSPGQEVLDQIKARVNKEIDARLGSVSPISQTQTQLLAKAYDVAWTRAYHNPQAIDQILRGLDGLFAAYRKNPKLAEAEPSTWNPDWFGLGLCGEAIMLRREQLEPKFDEMIDDGAGKTITRRAAYTEMLLATRDWHRLNRRQYTNQTMLNDLNGIYLPNRGIEVLSPSQALPEVEALRYLYESIGMSPWLDSDKGGRMWNLGDNYWQLTDKGLTKELGYVGGYGEVIDLVCAIYDATRPSPHEEGDPKIKEQLVRIALARAVFRHAALDAEGNRAMRLEQIVGWRDSHYPGLIAYGQRASRDASALQSAAITGDARLVGFAQQMIADNQFFASEAEAMKDNAQPLRTTIGRLATPDQYALIKAQSPSGHELPMTGGQPDFVFSDEEDGVVAIKNGEEVLYASLYWRARFGINNLARIHYSTPEFDRIAVVREETQFEKSGAEFVWPNWTNLGFGNGGVKYPGPPLQSAYAGEKQAIPKIAEGIPPLAAGKESPYAGRGDFYTLRYGPYLIGLNMTKDKTFDLEVPTSSQPAQLLTGEKGTVAPGSTQKIAPRMTTVLYLGGEIH